MVGVESACICMVSRVRSLTVEAVSSHAQALPDSESRPREGLGPSFPRRPPRGLGGLGLPSWLSSSPRSIFRCKHLRISAHSAAALKPWSSPPATP